MSQCPSAHTRPACPSTPVTHGFGHVYVTHCPRPSPCMGTSPNKSAHATPSIQNAGRHNPSPLEEESGALPASADQPAHLAPPTCVRYPHRYYATRQLQEHPHPQLRRVHKCAGRGRASVHPTCPALSCIPLKAARSHRHRHHRGPTHYHGRASPPQSAQPSVASRKRMRLHGCQPSALQPASPHNRSCARKPWRGRHTGQRASLDGPSPSEQLGDTGPA